MPSDDERVQLQQRVLTVTAYFIQIISVAAVLYQQSNYWQQAYHTSALSGEAWVNELIHGHPDRIFNELGNSSYLTIPTYWSRSSMPKTNKLYMNKCINKYEANICTI